MYFCNVLQPRSSNGNEQQNEYVLFRPLKKRSLWQVSLQGQWVPLSGIVMPFLGGSGSVMYLYLGGSGSEIVMLTLVAVALRCIITLVAVAVPPLSSTFLLIAS